MSLFAGVEILCSDKTGTLTKNKLTLSEPYTVDGVEADDLMLTACLAASRSKKGLDAIDRAFLKALKFYPRAKSTLTKYKVIEFHPSIPSLRRLLLLLSPRWRAHHMYQGCSSFRLEDCRGRPCHS